MYRIAIVEDDPLSTEKLTKYLSRFSQERDVQIKQSVFSSGVEFISDYAANFDVVLMDIEMPHMDGMEAARRLRKIDEEVCLIFVTNLAHYAIEGYEVRALDFLVKPVEYQNFSMKLQKALEMRSRVQTRDIFLSTPMGIQRVRLDEIYFIEVMDHNLLFHTAKGDFSERGSIKEREAQLSPYGFVRPSNSFLVNLGHVSALSKGVVTVKDREITIGRTKKKEFMKRLTEYMGESL